MIRIRLDEATLSRTRIAVSPLWETICGLFLTRRDEIHWPYTAWVRSAREVLRSEPATAPVRAVLDTGSRFPDFLSPIPPSACPTIGEELDGLRATAPEVVRRELSAYFPHRPPPELVPFLEDPARAFGELADALGVFWEAAMAPHWPAMRAALDEEVLYRARALAGAGPDALLAGLRDRIRWEPPTLTLVKALEHSFTADDQRLLLIPLIFSAGGLMCTTDNPGVVAVSYQSRGAVALAGDAAPRAAGPEADRLAILVGRGRASVLRALARPATTAGLAAELGLAPSTVSEHLSALLAAGVVNRRRVGRRVLYGLEPAGVALVGLLAQQGTTSAAG
ncbi:ArsR family transcriptional regulator [Sphaerisporangium perillae]|uniref:ArsR family transcriptional regulator n=1 Tax=Sphaerisporangium perillae TaxID=2935860 RepID=UPI00200BD530|nr:ArsR family transcriptional regulator [Sphaerisporangium perillae]